jgi:DNA-binding TFAR19-related protein (PDSD5 family)
MAEESEDKELEYLRAKKMLELRRKMAEAEKPKPKEISNRDVLVSKLVDRGLEVLETAERYYPEKSTLITEKLAEALKNGNITGPISGGELYWLFRQLGMPLNIPTSISIEKHGKLVPLTEKLKREE